MQILSHETWIVTTEQRSIRPDESKYILAVYR
jgi:hypothetical protein